MGEGLLILEIHLFECRRDYPRSFVALGDILSAKVYRVNQHLGTAMTRMNGRWDVQPYFLVKSPIS